MDRCLLLAVGCSLLLIGTQAGARVTGPCANCHTMHNSQNGVSVTGSGPLEALTTDTCVGCHSDPSLTLRDEGGGHFTPIVNTEADPSGVTELAGGNFYWVKIDPANGHNCLEVPGIAVDPDLNIAPGSPIGAGPGSQCNACHAAIEKCTGCHAPRHHADDSQVVVDAAGGFYRYLNSSAHGTDETGVRGIEDANWEYYVSASTHNEYAGAVDTIRGGVQLLQDDHSMSAYCSGCHHQFHGDTYTYDGTGDGHAPWIRHPTHLALASTAAEKEYHNYNDGGGYSPLAPIARDQDRLATMPGPTSEVFVASGQAQGDQVMCLSCHRAHGTPHKDMLRWDYQTCDASSGNADCGCFVCHTTKD